MIFPNYIICKYNIKKKENLKILNCYEEVKRKYPNWDWNSIGGVGNEEEIRKNCEVYLNENKKILVSNVNLIKKEKI